MGKMNAIEKRKEKIKPKRLFTIYGVIFDDGTTSGYGIEYRDLGRFKNQKLIVPDGKDFLALVRSITPSSIPFIEELTELIYGDNADTDGGHDKTACFTIEIYSDGFLATDFGEFIKGKRGPAKCWRLQPHEFINTIRSRLGTLSKPFEPLLKANNDVVITKTETKNSEETKTEN